MNMFSFLVSLSSCLLSLPSLLNILHFSPALKAIAVLERKENINSILLFFNVFWKRNNFFLSFSKIFFSAKCQWYFAVSAKPVVRSPHQTTHWLTPMSQKSNFTSNKFHTEMQPVSSNIISNMRKDH